jgi:LmbE family N-acetylglucosaminyl deacetylase
VIGPGWLARWRAAAERRGLPAVLLRAYTRVARDVTAPRPADPPGSRIVVLAPHMDDEVLGCGGTLARAAQAGAEVRVVFVTDGSLGSVRTPGGPVGAEATRELVARRKEESRRAGRRLGFAEPVFLDLADRAFVVNRGTVAALARALAPLRPQVVFLPFFADAHRDHVLATVLFARAARELRLPPDTECWSYEVWTPLPATTVVDITAVMDAKRAAMAEFSSQLEYCDYPRGVEALNAYRSLCASLGRGYAEAFHTAPLRTYLKVHPLV